MIYFVNFLKSAVLGATLFILYGLVDAGLAGEFLFWVTLFELLLIFTDLGFGLRVFKLDKKDERLAEMATIQKCLTLLALFLSLCAISLIPKELQLALFIYIGGRLLPSFFAVDHAVAIKSGLFFWDSMVATIIVFTCASVVLFVASFQSTSLVHISIVTVSQFFSCFLTVMKGQSYIPPKLKYVSRNSFELLSLFFAIQSKYRPILERLIAGLFLSPQEFALFSRGRTIFDSAVSALLITARTRTLLKQRAFGGSVFDGSFLVIMFLIIMVISIYLFASFFSQLFFDQSWVGLSDVLLPAGIVTIISSLLELFLAKRFIHSDLRVFPYIAIFVYLISFAAFCSIFGSFGAIVVLYGMIVLSIIAVVIALVALYWT